MPIGCAGLPCGPLFFAIAHFIFTGPQGGHPGGGRPENGRSMAGHGPGWPGMARHGQAMVEFVSHITGHNGQSMASGRGGSGRRKGSQG